MIPFDRKIPDEKSLAYVKKALESGHWTGDGPYTKACREWFSRELETNQVLLTTSCTHALEIAAILSGVGEGDEVIMPSYTFVSTANPFILRGAVPVFIDVEPKTMNMDPDCLESAITAKTKAVVPVHYGSVSCDMDRIREIAEEYGLRVIEDAAQAVHAGYKGKPLGTLGDFGAFSFHGTKNYACGEGGMIVVKEKEDFERAEIIREKGTNRSRFFRGMVDKYTWVDEGSSYLPSDILTALLLAQLEQADSIREARENIWMTYHRELESLEKSGKIERNYIPEECQSNSHLYFIKTACLGERSALISFLKKRDIISAFHYVPLHTSKVGRERCRFAGKDRYTTVESERLLRLPLWQGMTGADINKVTAGIKEFYA